MLRSKPIVIDNRIYRELYREVIGKDENKNGTCISAMLKDGVLEVCHYSWGSATMKHYGNYDVEYLVNFDAENTLLFKGVIGKLKDEPFMNRLVTMFQGVSAHTAIVQFCEVHQIVFQVSVY